MKLGLGSKSIGIVVLERISPFLSFETPGIITSAPEGIICSPVIYTLLGFGLPLSTIHGTVSFPITRVPFLVSRIPPNSDKNDMPRMTLLSIFAT